MKHTPDVDVDAIVDGHAFTTCTSVLAAAVKAAAAEARFSVFSFFIRSVRLAR